MASFKNIFPSIIERLKGTPLRLNDKVSKIPDGNLTIGLNNSWSIAENIGHLVDLEPLWNGRLQDILENKKELRHADLENKKLTGNNSKRYGVEY